MGIWDAPTARTPCRRRPEALARPSRLAWWAGTAAVVGGCNALWGIDNLTYSDPLGGGGTGDGGSDGGAAVCEPGFPGLCYSGPANTIGVGQCLGGERICNEAGTAWGPCEGEVLPSPEICGDQDDQDCDGIAPLDCLSNTGLLARYVIDEAAEGQTPLELIDTAPSPLALPITYFTGLTYTDVLGNRGLHWQSTNLAAGPEIVLDNTKLQATLDGATTITLEVVVRVDGVPPGGAPLIYFGIGSGSGDLALHAPSLNSVELYVTQLSRGAWTLQDPGERVVLHLVIDSDQVDAPDRALLYANGERAEPQGAASQPIVAGEQLQLNDSFALGHRPDGNALSFTGVLHYAAVYSTALTEEQVHENAQALLIDDDLH